MTEDRGYIIYALEARGPADIDRAFSDMTGAHAGALTVLPSSMFFNERRRLLALAAKNRLPAVYPWREGVDAGGLMAYGANQADLYRRAATYVDKIPQGRQTRRSPRRAADQIRAGAQPQDRQGARPRDPAVAAGAGGRGDSIQ